MSYTEVSFRLEPVDPWRDILIAELGARGYESFEEDLDGFKAFIQTEQFDREILRSLIAPNDSAVSIDWKAREIEDQNWNAVWEEAFQPVQIGKRVLIRAEHHEHDPEMEHEIIIQPRMAFGTGHHATTSMMVEGMLAIEIENRSVCDMGCGTAVLAILAHMRGGNEILAVDYDQNAVDNAIVNIERNSIAGISVEKGEVSALKGRNYDVILANIQRNVLSEGMATMAASLNAGGHIFLSGFILDDKKYMIDVVENHGLKVFREASQGEWVLLGCKK